MHARRTGSMLLRLRDKHGNHVAATGARATLSASLRGPQPARARLRDGPEDLCELNYAVSGAGEYVVALQRIDAVEQKYPATSRLQTLVRCCFVLEY